MQKRVEQYNDIKMWGKNLEGKIQQIHENYFQNIKNILFYITFSQEYVL